MRPVAALLAIALAGCKADSASHHPDAGADGGASGDGGPGGDEILVSPCRLTDLRGFCSAWDGTALDLRLGNGSPLSVDGDFTVPRPAAGDVVLLTLDDPAGGY